MHIQPALSRKNARFFALMATAAASWMVAMPASAQLSPALDRASISIGAFQTDPKFNASLNTPYGNLDSGDIKMGKETIARVKASVIIFDSQGLDLDLYQYKHNYNGYVSNNTNVNGTLLTTVGNANLDFQLDFAKLAYKWWFGSGNTVVGLGAGAGYYRLTMNANAIASINGSTASTSGAYSDEAVAPLLEIGARHAITPDLRLFADASGVQKKGGGLNGEIYNAAVGVEWFPAKNVGVVLDYSMNEIDLRRDDSSIAERFKVKFEGPSVAVKLRF